MGMESGWGRSGTWMLLLLVMGLVHSVQGQEFPPVPDAGIPRYEAFRCEQAMKIDGRLDEAIWTRVPRSRAFVDLISGQETRYRTQVAITWDDERFYLGYWIEEPKVVATFIQRDDPIWQDNDVEFFVAGDDAYYEFEINAHGTIYEGLFIWKERFESSGLSRVPELDVTRKEVVWQPFNGVGFQTHPRGERLAFLRWDCPGLESAVAIDGTLNDATDTDRGWTVEISVPWKSLELLSRTQPRALPPEDGDVWRMDFSRFNTEKAPAPAEDSGGWAWSHHGVWDSHIPECFTYVKFVRQPVPETSGEPEPTSDPASEAKDEGDGLDAALADALERAGENRAELEKALAASVGEELAAMRFLIAFMPPKDLKSLDAEFLREHVEYAFRAREATAWAKAIPLERFLEDVVPYACINERRDRWRKDFFERFHPMIKDCETASQAAATLNREVFRLLDVRYSTQRPKADQSPYESIDAKLASCTGLSVLLIDACRAVGVPARLVGTPLWSDLSGNHSWVEVWDGGWHFTGAAEPSGDVLNQAWFIDRASKAIPGHPRHGIFATAWRQRRLTFPMVWARGADDVQAVDVSHRYVERAEPLAEGEARVRFVARNDSGNRIETTVKVLNESGEVVFEGTTRDERFDANDHVTARLKLDGRYSIRWGDKELDQPLRVERDEQLVEIE